MDTRTQNHKIRLSTLLHTLIMHGFLKYESDGTLKTTQITNDLLKLDREGSLSLTQMSISFEVEE